MDNGLNNYALIVGVESYDHFASVPGARGDARALIHQCLAMGFSPARIRVLTSPVLSAAEVGREAEGVSFGDTTRASILDGLAWIYGALAGAVPAAGLATFSGHGLMTPGLVLCPSDFDGSAASAVVVSEVRAATGGDEAARRLTVLLDCCRAQGGARTTGHVASHLAEIARSMGRGEGRHKERLLAACGTDQVSVSSRFGGVMMGAFTWAVTSVLGQWSTKEEDGVAWINIGYGELGDRARKLLAALSFEQAPVLSGPLGLARHAFLHPGRFGGAGATSAEPDGDRAKRQIGPGVYKITVDQQLLGHVYATGSCTGVTLNGYPLQQNMEYWYLAASVVQKLASASSLVFSWAPIESDRNYTPDVTGDVAAAIFFQTTNSSGTSVWVQTNGSASPDGLTSRFFRQGEIYLQMIFDPKTGQIGQIYWYQQGSEPIRPTDTYEYSPEGPPFSPGRAGADADTGWYASANATLLGRFAIELTDQSKGDWFIGVGPNNSLVATTRGKTEWLFDASTKRILLSTNPSLVIDSDGVQWDQLTVKSYVAGADSNQAWDWSKAPGSYIILDGSNPQMGMWAEVSSNGEDKAVKPAQIQGNKSTKMMWTLV